MYACTPCVCLVPKDAGRSCWVPWNCSYRQSRAINHVGAGAWPLSPWKELQVFLSTKPSVGQAGQNCDAPVSVSRALQLQVRVTTDSLSMVLTIKTGLGRQGDSSSVGGQGSRSSRSLLAAMLEGGDTREDATSKEPSSCPERCPLGI